MMYQRTIPASHDRMEGSRGFTLIELLVAMGIIVLLMAMAVPAYRFITGTRSQGSAVNLIEAMLSRARGHAISTQRHAGVAFFVNPRDQRVTMAMVVERMPDAVSDEDAYLNYKGWNGNATYQYQRGQETIGPVAAVDRDQIRNVTKQRPVVRRFHYLPQNPGNGTLPNPAPPDENKTWGSLGIGLCMDFMVDGELQALPDGVGCQLINDPKNPNMPDRYVQTGCILFDAKGELTSTDLVIHMNGALGKLLNLQATVPANNVVFKSQLGIVLFDAQTFRTQGVGTRSDCMIAVNAYQTMDPAGDPKWEPAGGRHASYAPREQQEEAWLDQNGLQLLVSRYNGTLLRGE